MISKITKPPDLWVGFMAAATSPRIEREWCRELFEPQKSEIVHCLVWCGIVWCEEGEVH